MGIDRNYAEFLLGARNGGVDFRQTATLGRLNLFVDHRSLDAVFRKHGIPLPTTTSAPCAPPPADIPRHSCAASARR